MISCGIGRRVRYAAVTLATLHARLLAAAVYISSPRDYASILGKVVSFARSPL